jgi:hypothetical protein
MPPKKPEPLVPEYKEFQTYPSDHGFYLPGHGDYSVEPANLDELKAVMVQNDRQDIDDAALEISPSSHRDGILIQELPILNGAWTGFGAGITFDNLKPLTERSDSREPELIEARPTLYRGANKGQLNSSVIKALKPLIVPSRLSQALVVPNFFVEAWSDDSKADERKRQSLYTGCMGARGIQALQSYYGTTPIYDDNAYTIVADICDSILTLHSVHLTKPGECESSPSFHMTCLAILPMVSKDQFRAAVVAYRNLRDWADQKRDDFINSANERVMLPLSLAKHLGILGSVWLIDAPGNRKFAVLNRIIALHNEGSMVYLEVCTLV